MATQVEAYECDFCGYLHRSRRSAEKCEESHDVDPLKWVGPSVR